MRQRNDGKWMRRAVAAGMVAALGFAGVGLPGQAQAAQQAAHHGKYHARLERLERALKLAPEQRQAWQAIAAKRRALWRERRQGWRATRQALQAELAKPAPDLARVAAVRDQARAQERHARRELEGLQLRLYASFSPQQKLVLRDFLKARLARAEQRRAHRGRWHRGVSPAVPKGES